ncbi:glycosyltransferase [Phenylobacterium montanum]|uniref:Glycosyltransferase n=1 Tax=Phenylobacterium montanum TaxID=2823693 RepID=A0A975ITM2_9CAUL|nr:glycosyltransferase [Caulobacter sp. S6]QUD87017.1 glycosyltransferase [Caulobacter sp. S6]
MAILLGAFLLFMVLAAWPYTLYPLSLILMTRPSANPRAITWTRPPLAVCMSAFNEEKVIVAKIESLLAMARAYGPAEIYVYVDGAQDRTAELLQPYADRIHLTVSTARAGKTAGLNLLVAQTEAPLLAFTDANVETPVDSLIRLAESFKDPNVCCVSARLRYVGEDDSGIAVAGAVYWSLEETIKELESRTIGLMGVDGALFMIDRAAYENAPNHLIDDLYVSLTAVTTGRRVISAPDVTVHERGASKWREEFRRKARIACQAWNVHRTLWPRLRRLPPSQLYGYISHRVLKWMTPFTALLAGLSALGLIGLWLGPIVTAGLVVACVALFALGVAFNFGPARFMAMAAISLAGVARGILEAIFTNRTYTVWTPAASVREP